MPSFMTSRMACRCRWALVDVSSGLGYGGSRPGRMVPPANGPSEFPQLLSIISAIDVGLVSPETSYNLLSKNHRIGAEKDLYDFCLRWAQYWCGEDVTPENIRSKLGAARCLVRYSLMTPTEISDGPAKTGVLTDDEVKLVFRQKFGQLKDEVTPFNDQVRGDRENWRIHGVKVYVAHYDFDYCTMRHLVNRYKMCVADHHEVPLQLYCMFSKLGLEKYPFRFAIDGVMMNPKSKEAPTKKQEVAIRKILELKISIKYMMAGDVALSYDDETKEMTFHMATKPRFTPPGWMLVGKLVDDLDLEQLKMLRKIKRSYLLSGIGKHMGVYCEDFKDDQYIDRNLLDDISLDD